MDTQDYLAKMQNFQARLNQEPDPKELDTTPDGRAKTLPISFVEMTLDELFFGQWELSSASYQQVFNEVVGTAELTVWHPISGKPLKRTGFASVVITQDKDAAIADFQSTKKKNALDLTFPKLKSEILKNAAASLGKVFGRDINRKYADVYKPTLKALPDAALKAASARIEAGEPNVLALVESNFLLSDDQRNLLQEITLKKLSA